jgi:hypothetical protein
MDFAMNANDHWASMLFKIAHIEVFGPGRPPQQIGGNDAPKERWAFG